VISELGESVAALQSAIGTIDNRATAVMKIAERRLTKARGDWTIFWRDNGEIKRLQGRGLKLRPDDYPLVYQGYPINTSFLVLRRPFTAHAYSYTSKGCILDCFFCSERRLVSGPVSGLDDAGWRLANQFFQLAEIGKRQGTAPLSVFVEDSILLQGSIEALNQFSQNLRKLKPDIKFGAQFTIDMLLHPTRQEIIADLATLGLSYVFVGLETTDENIAQQMAKNIVRRQARASESWTARFERAMSFLIRSEIDLGISMMFGLGEPHQERLEMLEHIAIWQQKRGQPAVVSLNWAVRHPLRELISEAKYDYASWPIQPCDPRRSIIQRIFAEASTKLVLSEMASLADLQQIEASFARIKSSI
jgi:radical SAM superfamily enzyme YgiQ (UPF0313 family)